MLEGIKWLGHSSFRLESEGKVIYVDPFEIRSGDIADVICITHSHYDHLSPPDIKKIQGKNTVIVIPTDGARSVSGNVKIIRSGDKIEVNGVKIEAVPAYNIDKPNHPKANGWVGYIITLPDGRRFYHSGDTDFIPEMKDIKTDIAALAIGGTYTMNAEEAAQAANAINPKIAIPMHWGKIIGSKNDAETFKKNCKVEVAILKAE